MKDTDIDQHLDQIAWTQQQENGEVLLSPAWEVFILGVSMLSVFNLVVVWFLRNPDVDMVFIIMDAIMTFIFVADLLRRIIVADSARRYLTAGSGWVDALAAFPILRILRLLRILKMMRVMQRLGGPLRAFRAFFSNRAEGSLLSVLLVALLVMEFGALLELMAERGAPGATIETAQDAIWYVLVTMSTVGYGDAFPVTDAGRLIGAFIIVVGVGVFGTLTGFLANAFLSPGQTLAEETPPAGSSHAQAGSLDEAEVQVPSGAGSPDESSSDQVAAAAGSGADGMSNEDLVMAMIELASKIQVAPHPDKDA